MFKFYYQTIRDVSPARPLRTPGIDEIDGRKRKLWPKSLE